MQQQLEFAGPAAATTRAADLQASSDDPFARMLQPEPGGSNGDAGLAVGPAAAAVHPEKPQHGAAQQAVRLAAPPAAERAKQQAASAAPVTEQLSAAAAAAGPAEEVDDGFADFAAALAFLAHPWASSAPQLPADAGGVPATLDPGLSHLQDAGVPWPDVAAVGVGTAAAARAEPAGSVESMPRAESRGVPNSEAPRPPEEAHSSWVDEVDFSDFAAAEAPAQEETRWAAAAGPGAAAAAGSGEPAHATPTAAQASAAALAGRLSDLSFLLSATVSPPSL